MTPSGKPPGLSAATAVFEEHFITIAIPMDAASWGSAVELNESAGYESRLATARAFADNKPLGDLPEAGPGAFGLIMQLTDPEPSKVDFVIWPKAELDNDRYLLLECFEEPAHGLYGQPRTWRARLLQDQVRRARLGNIAIGVAADQETILIHDSSILFEDFIKHHPKHIDIYVTLKGRGLQRASIPVEYRIDPSKARPAPTFN